MTLDGLTLAALAAELTRRLSHGRVQKIVQPDPQTIALEIYANRARAWLVLSADPRQPRVYLAADKPGRGVESPTPLLLLLRKHVEGLRLGSVAQPTGERILRFEFVDLGPDDAPRAAFGLIIEAISQYSNLILVDSNGIVLDAARRISAEQNRTRVTLPHHPYQPPPPQAKRPLAAADALDCLAALQSVDAGAATWQTLIARFAGLGPFAAREITFRALGDARARVPADPAALGDVAERLAASLSDVVAPVLQGTFTASAALEGDEIIAFAPYALTHLGKWEARESLSTAADAYYRQSGGNRAVDIARRALDAAVAAERSNAERKRDALARALAGTGRADELRQRGDLILTHAAAIPRGATSLRADGRLVELDPRLSAVDNAQAIFRRYHKAKAALREVPTLIAEVELRLRYLDEIAALAGLAETAEDVRALRAELRPEPRPGAAASRRPSRKRPLRRPEQAILRLRTRGGDELLVGRSAQQNHLVTFELSRPQDVWLHARGCPGAHVILRSGESSPSRASIEEAAAVAARYSANRAAGKVTVDWTYRKYVRRLGKGTPGLVSYTNEQSVVVRPSDE